MRNLIVDLHSHGPESDGASSREDIIKILNELRKEKKLFISFTDHDTIDYELLGLLKQNKIPHCEGVEISTFFEPSNGEKKYLHLTAYAKHFSGEIMDILQNNMDGKTEKIKEQCKLLKTNGFDISYEDLIEYFSKKGANIGNLNIAHIAYYIFLDEKNKSRIKEITKIKDEEFNEKKFMNEFLRTNGKYSDHGTVEIPEYLKDVEEIGKICSRDGYLLSLAHPNITFNQERPETLLFIKEFIDYIKGIEINSQAPASCVNAIKYISKIHNLILTFGSDSHGTEPNEERGKLGDVNGKISQYLLRKNLNKFKKHIGIK